MLVCGCVDYGAINDGHCGCCIAVGVSLLWVPLCVTVIVGIVCSYVTTVGVAEVGRCLCVTVQCECRAVSVWHACPVPDLVRFGWCGVSLCLWGLGRPQLLP